MKQPAVYIITNKKNGALYTGVTSSLLQRIHQHKNNIIEGFTKQHGCKLLVYYELYDNMLKAIEREKQIKSGSRIKKLKLIESANPCWFDLFEQINKEN